MDRPPPPTLRTEFAWGALVLGVQGAVLLAGLLLVQATFGG